jgi:hypothetical protein
MDWLVFYGNCVRHATKRSWVVLGIISTVATYVPAVSAKLFGVVDLDLKPILYFSLPVAVILCFILVPFREAFKLNQEKEKRLQEKEAEISRLTAQKVVEKPIRLDAHQLWELFSKDPVGSQIRLRTVQLSGFIVWSGRVDKGYEIHLSGNPVGPATITSADEAWEAVARSVGQMPKLVVCCFDTEIESPGSQDYVEGEISEYRPQAGGGNITLRNCRIVKCE